MKKIGRCVTNLILRTTATKILTKRCQIYRFLESTFGPSFGGQSCSLNLNLCCFWSFTYNPIFPIFRKQSISQREYQKKKKLKKQQRYKQLEEERETEKNKWLAFTSKVTVSISLKKLKIFITTHLKLFVLFFRKREDRLRRKASLHRQIALPDALELVPAV